MPKFGVMVFEYSPAISSSLAAGSSPFLNPATVGSDNSAATQGSSTPTVAGKNRLPTMQCALAELLSATKRRIASQTAATLVPILPSGRRAAPAPGLFIRVPSILPLHVQIRSASERAHRICAFLLRRRGRQHALLSSRN